MYPYSTCETHHIHCNVTNWYMWHFKHRFVWGEMWVAGGWSCSAAEDQLKSRSGTVQCSVNTDTLWWATADNLEINLLSLCSVAHCLPASCGHSKQERLVTSPHSYRPASAHPCMFSVRMTSQRCSLFLLHFNTPMPVCLSCLLTLISFNWKHLWACVSFLSFCFSE